MDQSQRDAMVRIVKIKTCAECYGKGTVLGYTARAKRVVLQCYVCRGEGWTEFQVLGITIGNITHIGDIGREGMCKKHDWHSHPCSLPDGHEEDCRHRFDIRHEAQAHASEGHGCP